jgi:FixJ family two-component response regulator
MHSFGIGKLVLAGERCTAERMSGNGCGCLLRQIRLNERFPQIIMSESMPTVFIVEDESCVSRAFARLIRSAGYHAEVYDCAHAFLERTRVPSCPACVLLDVQLPDLNGIELQQELKKELPIVFVTGHGNIAMTVHAIRAGATDFLTKPVRDTDLLRAIAQALQLSVEISASKQEMTNICRPFDNLSLRERQVMDLVVAGLRNKQVAYELGVSEKTIKVHRASVMQKMGVCSLPELVRIAERIASSPQYKSGRDAGDEN